MRNAHGTNGVVSMYDNPKHIRDREIKIRVTDEVYALLAEQARRGKTQKAVLARQMVVDGLQELEQSEAQHQPCLLRTM